MNCTDGDQCNVVVMVGNDQVSLLENHDRFQATYNDQVEINVLVIRHQASYPR